MSAANQHSNNPAHNGRCLYCLRSPVVVKQMSLTQDADRLNRVTAMEPYMWDVCDACGFPHHRSRPFFLAIVGAPNAGKSTYLPVLIRHLDETQHNFHADFSHTALQTAVRNEDGNGFYTLHTRDLLSQRYSYYTTHDEAGALPTLPEKTTDSLAEARNRAPFLFHQSFPGFGWRRLLPNQEVTLCVRDCAGEEFRDENSTRQLHGAYLGEAGGILFCVAPEDLNSGADCLRVAETLISISREQSRRSRSKVPLALMITKFDEHKNDAPEFARYLNGASLASTAQQQAKDLEPTLRCWVTRRGGQTLLNILDKGFARTRVFAVSAVGHKPVMVPPSPLSVGTSQEHLADSEQPALVQQVGSVDPQRVLDPLLYIYRTSGLL